MPRIDIDIQNEYVLLVVAAFLLAIFLTYLLYRVTNPPVSRRLRGLLAGLRFLALFILLLLLLEPVIAFLFDRFEKPVVAVLFDGSDSMNLTDRNGDRRALCDSLLRSQTLHELATRYDLMYYQFATQTLACDVSREIPPLPQRRATDIGAALHAVQDSLRDANLQAFILLTDGGNNTGQEPGRAVRSIERPIYIIGIGDSTEQKDLDLLRVETNEITYSGTEIDITAIVHNSGLGQSTVPVSLKEGKNLLDRRDLLLSNSGGEQEITLRYTPQEEGFHKLTLSVPVQDGERISQNNERHFMVRVLKSKVKVLLLTGNPGFEVSFLKRTLEREPDIEMTTCVAKRNGGYYTASFPLNSEALQDYDAMILIGAARSVLEAPAAEMINRFVTEWGKALLFIPGAHRGTWSFYGDSPLADLLPVEITPQRGRNSSAPLTPRLTTEGLSHPITRLDDNPTLNEQKWSDLPPLLGAVQECLPKSQAMVLAEYPQMNGTDRALPFIVLWSLPKGKTMCINGFPLWRWEFLGWGIGKDNHEYVQFITNTVRWLTTQEQSEYVTTTTGKRMYHSGEPIDFFAQVYDEQYRALDGAEVNITIVPKDTTDIPPESREFTLSLLQNKARAGQYTGRLFTVHPGDYRFSGSASYKNRSLGRTTGEFSVEPYSLEFSNTRMDVELLRRMSTSSGGIFLPPQNFDRLSSVLNLDGKTESTRRSVVLWEQPLLLGLFLLSVFCEWTIRKRRGMV